MSTNDEQPPAPDLTHEDTGVIHDAYPGWFVTPEGQEDIERRSRKRQDEHAVSHMRDLIDRGHEVTCLACGDPFHPAYNSRSPRCARCRAAVQRAMRKGTA